MPSRKKFAYYKNLTFGQRRQYDKSDEIGYIPLPGPERFASLLEDLT